MHQNKPKLSLTILPLVKNWIGTLCHNTQQFISVYYTQTISVFLVITSPNERAYIHKHTFIYRAKVGEYLFVQLLTDTRNFVDPYVKIQSPDTRITSAASKIFHNDPWSFLMIKLCQQWCLYLSYCQLIALVLYDGRLHPLYRYFTVGTIGCETNWCPRNTY